MASVLHGCARSTPHVRAELKVSQTSSRDMAAKYGVAVKAVLTWRKRSTTADASMGPETPAGTVLTRAEKAAIVEFRRWTLLPLDGVMGTRKDTIPNLQRKHSLHLSITHILSRG